jgi:predicted RNA-binding protein with PUA-like domain
MKITMQYFLAKTDPQTYSSDDFARDKSTVWDGVTNVQAVQVIRAMRPGDQVFIYHSQGESAIVALAKVKGAPRPDPSNAKSWVVEMQFLRSIDPPATLSEIKSSGLFDDWALVRQGRLSTMAAPESFVNWMRERYPALKL